MNEFIIKNFKKICEIEGKSGNNKIHKFETINKIYTSQYINRTCYYLAGMELNLPHKSITDIFCFLLNTRYSNNTSFYLLRYLYTKYENDNDFFHIEDFDPIYLCIPFRK